MPSWLHQYYMDSKLPWGLILKFDHRFFSFFFFNNSMKDQFEFNLKCIRKWLLFFFFLSIKTMWISFNSNYSHAYNNFFLFFFLGKMLVPFVLCKVFFGPRCPSLLWWFSKLSPTDMGVPCQRQPQLISWRVWKQASTSEVLFLRRHRYIPQRICERASTLEVLFVQRQTTHLMKDLINLSTSIISEKSISKAKDNESHEGFGRESILKVLLPKDKVNTSCGGFAYEHQL